VITPLTVTGSFTASNKIYDGNALAMITGRSLTGQVSGDDVSVSGGTATFADKHAGPGKTVTGTGFGLSGLVAGDYQLASSTITTTASITRATVTVTADSKSITFGQTIPNLTAMYVGLISGDTIAGVTVTTAATASSPGGAYPITAAGPATTTDYNVSYVAGTLTIGYRFYGMLQPINDADVTPGLLMSTFKSGSVVPVKFQLLDGNNQSIPAALASAIATNCQARINVINIASSAPAVDETQVTGSANSGVCFRYDSTANQFIFNLNTKTYAAPATYRITASILGSDITTQVGTGDVSVGFR
jgi:hypothetical protein